MAAELGSIATKAVEKKSGKNIGLNALLKLGALDDKFFAEKLSKALENSDTKSLKPMILELKKEIKSDKHEQKVSKKETKQELKSHDDAREFLFKQAMSVAKLSNEVGVEKAIKELRDYAKNDKKLSALLEKVEKEGIKVKIAFEKEGDEKETKQSKPPKEAKKSKEAKKTDEPAQKDVPKEIKKEEPKQTAVQIVKDTKKESDEQSVKIGENTQDAKAMKDELALRAKNDANKKAQDAKDTQEAQSKHDKRDLEASAEYAKASDKKNEEKKIDDKTDAKPLATNNTPNQQVVQKKDEKEVEVKEAPKEQKVVKNEAPKEEKKNELLTENALQKVVQKDATLTQPEKVSQNVKKDEKPIDLIGLLAGLEDTKAKKDESLTSRSDKEGKQEQQKDNLQDRLAQLQSSSGVQNSEDNIGQKVRDAAVTIKNFAEDLKDKIDEYKPPLMKVSMELRPENMPPVDVTMITRGQNLIVNINSGEEALKMFLNNASDFRQNLMDIGFTEMTMNFNFKDQNGEKRQYQFVEQKAKKYKEIEEISSTSTITDIEVIVPRYA